MRGLAIGIALLALCGAARAESPELNYMLQCRGCHLSDGAGTPGVVPPLAGHVARFLTVPGGREFLVRVPGSAQSALDDTELAELLNWMMQRFGPAGDAANFVPYTAAEVAPLRRDPLTHVAAARRALLAKMAASHTAEAEEPPR